MCGIAGIYRLGDRPVTDATRAEDRRLVEAMLRAIEYRGPDDAGLESPGRVTMGVRRLSILDVAGGHQPLCDAGGRVWASQNGELYNYPRLREELSSRHALRTRTDTEVLPHLWLEHGPRAVERLRGMFACAVFDTRDETLMLARDPLGVKPLYWAVVGQRLLYASEIKALLCDPGLPRDLDPDGVERYLALGFVPGEATALRAVRKLRPGCRMLVDPAGTRIERWWEWPVQASDPAHADSTLDALADGVGARLAESTRAMLLSDRPVGILLSGGLDSSLMVASLPEELRRETRTFTIGFDGGGHHDERGFAREVAERFGTRHHESIVTLDPARTLPRVAALLDEPCADPAAVPAHLVAMAASEHVTVLLSGTGGDELFGGYRRHRLPGLLRRLAPLPPALAGALARRLADRDQHRSTAAGERLVMARKLLEARARGPFFAAYLSALEPAPPALWRTALAPGLASGAVAARLEPELTAETGGRCAGAESLAAAVDHLWYLPDDLLLKEDRTTMGASVEGRVPFLDDALVRFAAGLPRRARFGEPGGKAVLRALARRVLPERLAARPKHGFSVPVEEWLRGPLDSLAGDLFAGAGSGVFRMDVLRRWHDEHRRRRDRSGPLWAALCFELWWNEVARADAGALARVGTPVRPSRVGVAGGARP